MGPHTKSLAIKTGGSYVAAILGTSDFVLGSVDKSTRYDYTNAITIGTIISGVLVIAT